VALRQPDVIENSGGGAPAAEIILFYACAPEDI
jgi:hypothetical protein